MQVEPMKPVLKASGSMLLKLKYHIPPSDFAFKFHLRRYSEARRASRTDFPLSVLQAGAYRGLHSSTSQLNLSRFCH